MFDAPDETDVAETRKPFLEFLNTFGSSSKIRMFVMSRPHCQNIHTAFEGCSKIRKMANEDDLRVFIRSQVNIATASDLMDDNFEAEMSNQLVQSAKGLFLLPALQLICVLQEPIRKDVEDALQDFPNSRAGMLDNDIGRILYQTASRRTLALNALI